MRKRICKILRTILKKRRKQTKNPTWTDRKKGTANFFPLCNLVLIPCLTMI